MSDFDFLKKKELYIDYFHKGSTAYADKVRFYEEHKSAFEYLEPYQRNEINIDFVICLFEIGRYERFLKEIDPIIELVINDNIYMFEGKNIFNFLLRKKASCYINLKKYEKALPLIEQLIRIDNKDPNLPYLYYLSSRNINIKKEEILKGTAIIALMSGVSLKFAETFVIDPFFSEYLSTFSTFTIGLFLIGGGLLFFNELYTRFSISRKLSRIKNSDRN